MLWLGAVTGCQDRQKEAQRMIQEAGFTLTMDDFGRVARMGRLELVKAYLAAGLSVDGRNSEQCTALFQAAAAGQTAVVSTLLEAGAEPNVAGTNFDTALIAAARAGQTECIGRLIASGAKAEHRTPKNWTALTAAAYGGQKGTCQLLVEKAPQSLDEALHMAAIQGETSVMACLLEAQANVYWRNAGGKTALMYAAMNGHEAAAKLLLEHGANRQDRDGREKCAQDYAAEMGHQSVVTLLETWQTASNGDTKSTANPVISAALTAPDSAQPVTRDASALRPLQGAHLPEVMSSRATLREQLIVKELVAEPTPVLLSGVGADGQSALLTLAETPTAPPMMVKAGREVPGTGLELVRAQRREADEPSEVTLRHRQTGETVRLRKGEPAPPLRWHAVLSTPSGETFQARTLDEFSLGAGAGVTWRVSEIQPTQLVLQHGVTGETVVLRSR
jgi:ankyrin repeat protein